MTVLVQTEIDEMQKQFQDLLENCIYCNTDEDRELMTRAFNFALEAHKGMRRKSGEPYIMHPIAVAKIANQEIGLGITSIVSSLLHDTVEDTDYTLEDIERNFGSKIAAIIDGLTKISGVFDNKSSLQAENFRKMLLTLSNDVRVILIKLADRLHNMRTLDALPRHKQIKIAGETTYLFAPLAHRLGLYSIKTELEDLSLKYRYPRIFEEISAKIRDNEEKRINLINKFSLPIIEKLVNAGIQFNISGRPKSIYSIWNKMQQKNVGFEEIFDLLAIRIVFEPNHDIPEKTQCWNIYSMITDIYPPRPDRIRDWISTPKANGYEALHVTVMGPYGKWIEVQIRSKRMDEIAERGFAAHWKYKEPGADDKELDKWLKRIRELLENPNSDALEFLDDFKMNLFSTEIFVFTPKGHIKTLPSQSTTLDFAYEIHSEIGNKAIGAKVNHHLVGLNHVLQSGDQVEIITSEKKKIERDRLNYVITVKAKSAIKAALKAETKNRIEVGKRILEDKLKELKLLPSSRVFKKLLPAYEAVSKDELYSKIGSGFITLDDLKKILRKNTKNKWIKYWDLTIHWTKDKQAKKTDGEEPFVLREAIDESEQTYTLATCCNPIPGDEVIGFINDYDTITVHQARCNEALKIVTSQGNRVVSVKWTKHKILAYLVRISINGYDRFGVYNNITNVISTELSVNIRTINLHSHDGIFEGNIDLYVHNTTDLNNLIMNLMKIKGVEGVHRIEVKD